MVAVRRRRRRECRDGRTMLRQLKDGLSIEGHLDRLGANECSANPFSVLNGTDPGGSARENQIAGSDRDISGQKRDARKVDAYGSVVVRGLLQRPV